jgi:hypothetical protein
MPADSPTVDTAAAVDHANRALRAIAEFARQAPAGTPGVALITLGVLHIEATIRCLGGSPADSMRQDAPAP